VDGLIKIHLASFPQLAMKNAKKSNKNLDKKTFSNIA
jgi:hypothetical protein